MYTNFGLKFLWNYNEASVGMVSQNLSLCTGNSTILIDSIMEIEEQYAKMLFTEAGYSTYDILKSIDDITFSCYFTALETYLAYGLYINTMTDWKKLLYNVTHNLGSVYDLTEELVYRIMDWDTEYKKEFFWSRTGTICGSLFQDFFEDPVNYYPFDPTTVRED